MVFASCRRLWQLGRSPKSYGRQQRAMLQWKYGNSLYNDIRTGNRSTANQGVMCRGRLYWLDVHTIRPRCITRYQHEHRGSISPLSSNGYPFTPIASPVINGVQFDLAYGLNGNVKVYSFVARNRAATSFSGDFLNFYKYLQQNYASNGFNSNLYLQAFQAGTEVFTGSNVKFDTTAYSVSIN